MFKIFHQQSDFTLWREQLVFSTEVGGKVEFEGRVRKHHDGREVRELHYEGYEAMIVTQGNHLLKTIRRKHGLIDLFAGHFLGQRKLGEIAVIVIAGGVHRRESFLAASEMMEEIKKKLPIWKKEIYADDLSLWNYHRSHRP